MKKNCIMPSKCSRGRIFLKIGRGGYDGRGQARIGMEALLNKQIVTDAWTSVGENPPSPNRRSTS